jgi:hypothetical protein
MYHHVCKVSIGCKYLARELSWGVFFCWNATDYFGIFEVNKEADCKQSIAAVATSFANSIG